MPKKNNILHLYIDHEMLNDIIIKNQYSILNINNLQDKFSNEQYFTKLNLQVTYNLIKMKEAEELKIAFQTLHS